MYAAGFQSVFCNVGDHTAEEWAIVRSRALALGMFCGPWARTAKGSPAQWDQDKLDLIIATADAWGSPLVVNSEKEIDGSGATYTTKIAAAVGARDGAISTEPTPFASVDWAPVAHLPVLPQNFPAEQGMPVPATEALREAWWNYGIKCVYVTFGTYAGAYGRPEPSWYVLQAPYSLYTADDIEGGPTNYGRWSPTSAGYQGCQKEEPPVPTKPPLSEKEVPYTGPYSLASGSHRSRGPTAKALKIAMKRMGQEPFAGKDNSSFDEHYNQPLEDALDRTTNASWSGYGEKRWEAVRGLVTAKNEYALNKEARDLILRDYAQMTQPEVPEALLALGPLVKNGKSMLDFEPTHSTSGIPLYIAYDTAFAPGTTIIAPEDIEIGLKREGGKWVSKSSSANPGAACYARGASDLGHWFAHLVSVPAVGVELRKGDVIGKVLDHEVGGGPHCHHAVNIEAEFGTGEQLEWGADGDGPNYTFGSPTIREQLEARML